MKDYVVQNKRERKKEREWELECGPNGAYKIENWAKVIELVDIMVDKSSHFAHGHAWIKKCRPFMCVFDHLNVNPYVSKAKP